MSKGHGGFSACERCLVYGKRCEHRTIYQSTTKLLRTGESFRNQNDPEHHNGWTPLLKIEPKINLVSQFLILCTYVVG